MEFAILGSLEADSGRLALGPSERKVLAVLLLAANRVVPLSRLADALWEDDPPATAAKQVRNAVSRLRLQLGASAAAILVTEGAGYRIGATAETLDALRFASLVAQA
nr:winged helix-turn-helix domain-containing protein [Actinomycetota bacterium]